MLFFMSEDSDRYAGIDKALDKGLILLSGFSVPGGHRTVHIIDPREEPESRPKVYGSAGVASFPEAVLLTSRSFLEGGRRVHPYYMCCAIEHGCQTLSDRFHTAGGTVRAYRKDGETHVMLRDFRHRRLNGIVDKRNFSFVMDFLERFLSVRPDIFRKAYCSVPKFFGNNYQSPRDVIEDMDEGVLRQFCIDPENVLATTLGRR